MTEASGLFRVLGDDARLRLLRLLLAERLNVSELTAILGIAQSGVSRHLGLLRDAGLVRENRDGGFTYYQPSLNGDDDRLGAVWSLRIAQSPRPKADILLAEEFADDGGGCGQGQDDVERAVLAVAPQFALLGVGDESLRVAVERE